ncbi:MAG: membrane protein [Steroidobacteraceae bacterium]
MNDTTRMLTAGLAALLVGGFTAAALAQDAPRETRIITFDQAIEIALQQNDVLRSARNAAALGELGVDQARTDFLPDLGLSARTSRDFDRDDTSQTTSLNLSSGVTLFDGFANTAGLKAAKLASRASGADLARTGETVIFTVATDFLALVQSQEQLRVQRENLAAQVALGKQIDAYVRAGARTIADQYQQEANVASAKLAVVEAERAAELAKVDVILTLQLDPRGTYEFVAPAVGQPGADALEPLDALIARAWAARADVAAGEARAEAALQDIRVAKSGRWPVVGLSAGYGSSFSSDVAPSWNDQLDDNRGGAVGLTVTMPLYDRGATRIATRRAELAADNAQIALDSLRQQVGSQVRRAVLDLESAREQLLTSEAQQRAAARALEVTEQRYRAGAATLVELTQSRATQVQAAGAYVTAKYEVEFQRRLLDYYVGGLTAERVRFEQAPD